MRGEQNMNNFIKMSKYAGMREDLVQAGGGNSSFKKSEDRMVIKASGYSLADVSESQGYAIVNPNIIKDFFMASPNIDSIREEDGKRVLKESFVSGERPSIETFLHAVSERYTLHTHPVVVNALVSRKNGIEELKKLFPEAIMIPYATPGVGLAKAFFKEYRKQAGKKSGNIFFLKNHGLVVSADNAEEIISETERITKSIEYELKTSHMEPYHDLSMLWKHFNDGILLKVTDENVNRVYKKSGFWNHRFCPDCIVFLGKRFMILENDFTSKDVGYFIEKYGHPTIIEYKDSLYILAESVKKAMETQSVLSFSAQVMELNMGYECDFLTEDEQNFLLNWDAEKYRKSMK